jgi:FtsP/CotA-like multicopper oxidase with cupredoxin domain
MALVFGVCAALLAACGGSGSGGSTADATSEAVPDIADAASADAPEPRDVERLTAAEIPQFVAALPIPGEMPFATETGGVREYHVAARRFEQQVLPDGFPPTPVYGYGAVGKDGTFHFPGFTFEVRTDVPIRVKWVNDLVDGQGHFLTHDLPIDVTVHWANPGGEKEGHTHGAAQYSGPIPLVTHVHGAHVADHSDGGPEAWYLPAAEDVPAGFRTQGSGFTETPGVKHEEGAALYTYSNDQPASTVWYHDHALGVTRVNVYAGLAGFYLIRDEVEDSMTLPGPAPRAGDPPDTRYYEIPLAIQDRSFLADGGWYYPGHRSEFDGYEGPFTDGMSHPDLPSPVWNPEYFGDVMVVNGRTWPYLEVEPRKYRFRLLNGCNSRFLILRGSPSLTFQVIAAEQGFLPGGPVDTEELLLAPGERYDVVVDFGGYDVGDEILLENAGPDEPYGGGVPGEDFESADPSTTGRVLQFRVVPLEDPDLSKVGATPVPDAPLSTTLPPRDLTLNEVMHVVGEDEFPVEAVLGTLEHGPLEWDSETVGATETPTVDTTERWRIINFTGDAHPVHLHLVRFQLVSRTPVEAEGLLEKQKQHLADPDGAPLPELEAFLHAGDARGPEPWEAGYKDTVIAYPGEVTEIIAHFDMVGNYVWHCHILDHEDNEMMRPLVVVEAP